ncbi:hypothetical protein BB561_002806 [Smittium simulii]|uniref:Ribonuclease P protein subunit n=1 Tax=Smittium simulii TaxID=133385 RepID=A0A2T9YP26_9FUNG|nr:hypothetical protein BB561_002806 [Smittium simulii]
MDIYSEIPEYVKKNVPLELGVPLNEYTKTFTKDYVLELLPSNVKKDKIYETKVERKVVSLQSNKRIEEENNLKSKKEQINPPKKTSKRLSSKLQKKLGIYNIPKDNQKYSVFEPLNVLWSEYILRVLANSTGPNAAQKIIKADFHGSILSVVKAKCYSLVGKEGIVIQETKNTFKIITKTNNLLVIPKTNTIFEMKVSSYKFTFFGNQIMYKSSERATKKFKPKPNIDL